MTLSLILMLSLLGLVAIIFVMMPFLRQGTGQIVEADSPIAAQTLELATQKEQGLIDELGITETKVQFTAQQVIIDEVHQVKTLPIYIGLCLSIVLIAVSIGLYAQFGAYQALVSHQIHQYPSPEVQQDLQLIILQDQHHLSMLLWHCCLSLCL